MMNTVKFDRATLVGYIAGIITGVTYGLNPLFAMPLMNAGAPVENILFFRYGLSVLILGCWLLAKHESFRVSGKQLVRLLILGACFTMSSLFLFEAYHLIPSGMTTTIVFLYPVLVALIMVFMRVYPTWQVWFSIILTFIGVFVLSRNGGTHVIQTKGIVIAAASALAYAMFIVIVNRSKAIRKVSNTLLTFYALIVGTVVFMVKALAGGHSLLLGISGFSAWGNLMGLAVLPTIVSTATLALATRKIGAAKASVLGVFEPITAILVGALAFGEPVTMNVLIGIGLTMAAVTFMIVSSNK